jgi:hypothetical protein
MFTTKLKREENIMGKKVFIKPELTVHGDIEKITLAGNLANADMPKGTAGSAECVKGSPGCIS